MSEVIKLLIVEDHALVRKGLLALLDNRSDIAVIGEAADGHEAVYLAEHLLPDVILMDLDLPRQDGALSIEKIRGKKINSKILVLTSYTDNLRVISAIRAGADGYLLKTAMPTDLVNGIVDVYNGRTPLDPAISGTVLKELSRAEERSTNLADDLTEREVTVLKLIAKGHTNHQIAVQLDISERTVSTHVSHILKKLHVANRTQAAFYALRSGLMQDNPDSFQQ